MELKHIALVSRTEEDADLFFEKLLGLTKEPPKILPEELSEALFDICGDLMVIHYSGMGMRFEIFVTEEQKPEHKSVAHVCLETPDRSVFLDRCGEFGFKILRFPKGGKVITFVKDKTGNLYEIK